MGGSGDRGWQSDPMASTFLPVVDESYCLQHGQVGRSDEAGPQGKGYQDDLAFTLDARPVADVVAYQVTFCDSNGQRQDRPDGGLYVTEDPPVAGTIPTSGDPGILVTEDAQPLVPDTATLTCGNRGISPDQACAGIAIPVAFAQGMAVRRLTPTECARLQGFSDDWNGFLADGPRYKQFGNAISVPVAEWIGHRIVEGYGSEKRSANSASTRTKRAPRVPATG